MHEMAPPSKIELEQRLGRLHAALIQSGHRYDTAIICNRVNQYYLTGTMQDGLLVLRRDGSVLFFVRKSVRRAGLESPLPIIRPMSSYKDMLNSIPADLGSVFIETGTMTVAILERLKRHFTIDRVHSIEGIIARLRMVKSPYEIALIREAGVRHGALLNQTVPALLRPGISEAQLMTDIYARMVEMGHHGVSRFSMFQMEMVIGQIGFGEASIYPTSFDGPGGMAGLSAAAPSVGSRSRLLHQGDLVFVDVGFGVAGYHSDKTRVYSFGAKPPKEALEMHRACMDVLAQASSMLRPGAIPSEIYQSVMESLPDMLKTNFMGYGEEKVKFIGHGVGLHIDEIPVIAPGFNQPLVENTVIALEPKCGVSGVGMVGVEETFLVSGGSAECLTGGADEIMVVSFD